MNLYAYHKNTNTIFICNMCTFFIINIIINTYEQFISCPYIRSCQCILQIRAVPDGKGTAEPPANTAQESPPSAVANPNRAGTPNSGRRNASNDLAFEHPEMSWGDGYRYI